MGAYLNGRVGIFGVPEFPDGYMQMYTVVNVDPVFNFGFESFEKFGLATTHEGIEVKQCPFCKTTEWKVNGEMIKNRKFMPGEVCGGKGPNQEREVPCKMKFPEC